MRARHTYQSGRVYIGFIVVDALRELPGEGLDVAGQDRGACVGLSCRAGIHDFLLPGIQG